METPKSTLPYPPIHDKSKVIALSESSVATRASDHVPKVPFTSEQWMPFLSPKQLGPSQAIIPPPLLMATTNSTPEPVLPWHTLSPI
ncbi:hypothetical protein M407DRAFT_34844 [Tulasnella calospora MUT 4182]|uniref:Uncharacterized protein n=1 Tax=Tulasnella calospora MUT 4182 TaxID=1051891 RepID=A0A0C3L1E2_9AGAM|nr:hypothetical protein M407DRAFT_34844 [Tulasnella calospora MUT 4182]